MRSGNPALSDKTLKRVMAYGDTTGVMTLDGTVNKAGFLLFCVLLTACWTWYEFYQSVQPDPAAIMTYVWVGFIGGFIAALATIFKPTWAPVSAPIYALLEGFAIGGLSAIMELQFPGIVIQAVGLTFGVFLALLVAYKSGLIRATENFKLGVVAATGGIFIVYLATMIMGFFGWQVPYIHGNGPIGIGFSLVVVVIASLNLVLDFDFIEQGAARGFPKYMEWYGAFGLIVTLVWLYLEMLRLLSKLRGN